jgi:dipeptidyl-peptidase-4
VHGVDNGGRVYFSATERTSTGEDIYRIKLDGTGLERLSKTPGTHGAQFSPDLAYYFDRWSAVMMPPQVRLHRADGSELRTVHANVVDAFSRRRNSCR